MKREKINERIKRAISFLLLRKNQKEKTVATIHITKIAILMILGSITVLSYGLVIYCIK